MNYDWFLPHSRASGDFCGRRRDKKKTRLYDGAIYSTSCFQTDMLVFHDFEWTDCQGRASVRGGEVTWLSWIFALVPGGHVDRTHWTEIIKVESTGTPKRISWSVGVVSHLSENLLESSRNCTESEKSVDFLHAKLHHVLRASFTFGAPLLRQR